MACAPRPSHHCSLLGSERRNQRHRDTPHQSPSDGRGHVSYVSAQLRGVIRGCAVGKIDDLHFLHWQQHGGIEISNHFKYITNDFPFTLVSIGIGLRERGVLMDAS